MTNRIPPVTIGITTYNSATTVVETLDSIFNQAYQALHLIVSDDASHDDTLDKVRSWLDLSVHHDRFISIKVLTVPLNTGVSANCNRIISSAATEWIKFIAGDDILLPNCIRDNMIYVEADPDARVLFSQVLLYGDSFNDQAFLRTIPAEYPANLMTSTYSAEDQWKILLQSDRINYTPSYFFHKSALAQVGNYDESNRLVEDYPMWLKLTRSGIKLSYFHKPTVGYRIHQRATNNVGNEVLFKPSAINGYGVRKIYVHPFLPITQVWHERWVYNISFLFQRFGLNRNKKHLKQLYRMLTLYVNPFVYINAMNKRFSTI